MLLNADFSKPAVVIPTEKDWIDSPASGVSRLMLDRIGDEVARATSIVRYASGSRFSRHEHAKGEEFLVLNGIFSDEHGDYPTGTYVRNPPGSGHSPFSENGCRILVKLRQFDPTDLAHVVINTNDDEFWQIGETDPLESIDLHKFGSEEVRMLRLPKEGVYSKTVGDGGFEALVVSGSIEFGTAVYRADSWLRMPRGTDLQLCAAEPTTLWVKCGHLPGQNGPK